MHEHAWPLKRVQLLEAEEDEDETKVQWGVQLQLLSMKFTIGDGLLCGQGHDIFSSGNP